MGKMKSAMDKGFQSFSEWLQEEPPNTKTALRRYKAGKAGFTDVAHLKAKGLIKRKDGTKGKSEKYK
tara:strand:- start:75 stop:275 length:201 start_codon:yes stop_codon:yes gene_type:complete